MAVYYNLKNIRRMLINGFSTEELRTFCFEQPQFRPVYHQLAANSGRSKIAQQLLEYADRKELIEPLLAWAQEQNPGKYETYEPYRKIKTPVMRNPRLAVNFKNARTCGLIAILIDAPILICIVAGFLGMMTPSFLTPTSTLTPTNRTRISVKMTPPTLTTPSPIFESSATPQLTNTPVNKLTFTPTLTHTSKSTSTSVYQDITFTPTPVPSTPTPIPTPTTIPPTPTPVPPTATDTPCLSAPRHQLIPPPTRRRMYLLIV